MFCAHCGKQIEDGGKFCPYCGKEQPNRKGSILFDENSHTSEGKSGNRVKNSDSKKNIFTFAAVVGFFVLVSFMIVKYYTSEDSLTGTWVHHLESDYNDVERIILGNDGTVYDADSSLKYALHTWGEDIVAWKKLKEGTLIFYGQYNNTYAADYKYTGKTLELIYEDGRSEVFEKE